MDLELTWFQSLKVVLVRGVVALGLGFGIGRLVLMGMQYGFLSESVLREHALVSVGGSDLWAWFVRCVSVDHREDLWKIDQRRFCDQSHDVRVWLLCAVDAYLCW
jgi:hypothetical protein